MSAWRSDWSPAYLETLALCRRSREHSSCEPHGAVWSPVPGLRIFVAQRVTAGDGNVFQLIVSDSIVGWIHLRLDGKAVVVTWRGMRVEFAVQNWFGSAWQCESFCPACQATLAIVCSQPSQNISVRGTVEMWSSLMLLMLCLHADIRFGSVMGSVIVNRVPTGYLVSRVDLSPRLGASARQRAVPRDVCGTHLARLMLGGN